MAWTSTLSAHADRTYIPRPARFLETGDPLPGRKVQHPNGTAFTFCYCGCDAHCQCYDIFDEIKLPLLVACDAGVKYAGSWDAIASMGIYFGKNRDGEDSTLNFSELIPSLDPPRDLTSVRAEITAVRCALQTVRHLKSTGTLINIKEVVIKTDCERVSAAMTTQVSTWRLNGWVRTDSHPVSDRDLLWQLEELIVDLYNQHGVAVRFFWVPRAHNTQADRLAGRALAKEDLRRKDELVARYALIDNAILGKRERDEHEEELPDPKRQRLVGASGSGSPVPAQQQDYDSSGFPLDSAPVSPDHSGRDSAPMEGTQVEGAQPGDILQLVDGVWELLPDAASETSVIPPPPSHSPPSSLDDRRQDSAAVEGTEVEGAQTEDLMMLVDGVWKVIQGS